MITMEMLEQLSIEPQVVVAASSDRAKLVGSIHSFLSNGSLPRDTKEAEKVQRTTAHFKAVQRFHLEDHTCYVFIPAKLLSCWPSFMREYVVATRGVGHSHTQP